MGWIKLDDAFLDHPKFLAAGPLAGYLNIAAIAWSNRNRTDGWIPRAQVRRLVDFEGFGHHMWMGELVGGGDDVDPISLAEELIAAGLWENDGRDFRVHDYHEWQRSSDEIEAGIEQRREAGRKGGRARSGSGSLSASANGTPSGSSSGFLSDSSSESPSKTQAEVRSKK